MSRRSDEAAISLFPFLSILVCMMGVLAFIMVSVAVVSATNPKVELDWESLTSNERKAVIVECRGDALFMHSEGQEVPLEDLEAKESPFIGLIDGIAETKEDAYLFIVVFPDGIGCFYRVRDMAESRKIDLGFEPLLENWQLGAVQSEGETS